MEETNFFEMLCNEFPFIYDPNNRWSMPSTQKGWDEIIISLSSKINEHVKHWSKSDQPKVLQIKEKFGELRFYISTEDIHISKLISEAEYEAFKTCEFCGNKENIRQFQKGKRKYGWIKRLCEKCGQEWEKPY